MKLNLNFIKFKKINKLKVLLDVSNNKIRIIYSSDILASYQINQLIYWGFNKNNDNNALESPYDNRKNFVFRVFNYFNDEGLSFGLSSECQKIIEQIKEININFENIKKIGKLYKEGKLNKNHIKEFIIFADSKLNRKLKSHQLKAASHLYLLLNGANFSVPGSGKTSVVLSVYEKLRLDNKINVLFVIGPPSCFGPWRYEFEQTLGRKPNFQILAGGDKKHRKSLYYTNSSSASEVYFSTFQTLLQDEKDLETFLSQQGMNVYLVIDEAHYIKQIEGNWSKAVLNIAKFARYRCILTGTPLPKSYSDIFNLFDFLWPDNSPISSIDKMKIKKFEDEKDFQHAKKIIMTSISPFFYRVSKSELKLKPPIFHRPFIINMNQKERFIYDSIEKKIQDLSEEDYLKNLDIVTKLRKGRITRLRQSISYTRLLNTAVEGYEENVIDEKNLKQIISKYDQFEKPAKLEFLLKFLEELKRKKEKVVIWTNFIGTIDLLHRTLTENGYYNKLIYGKTPTEQTDLNDEETREKIRDEFVLPDSGLNILIANPAACSESISLHKTCHNALYYDLSYNCAQYLQSLDRIHRVGGSENIEAHYYFLLYKDTIDKDILINVRKKAKKMYDIIEEGVDVYSLDMFEDEEQDQVNAYKRIFKKNE